MPRIHAVDTLYLDQVAAPECGPDDVVVRVRECGICGSDLGYLAMGGITAPGTPMPLGHELWGEVGQVGENVQHVQCGDAVVVQPMSNGNSIGNGGSEGGFTPELLVRNAALDTGGVIKLPSGFAEEFGPLVEPLAVAQHGANRVAATAQDKAVIFGAGPIGLSLLQVLSYRGLSDIAVVDLSQAAPAKGRRIGRYRLIG